MITTQALTGLIQTNLGGRQIVGSKSPDLAKVFASSFVSLLPQLIVTTTHTGITGAGTGTGKVFIEPTLGISLFQAQMTARGLVGSNALDLASGIIQGISQAVNTLGLVSVTIVGTSTGTGVGSFSNASALGQVFTSLLNANFASNGMTGSSSGDLASASAIAIVSWLNTAVINTVDVGVPTPPNTLGVGSGIGTLS